MASRSGRGDRGIESGTDRGQPGRVVNWLPDNTGRPSRRDGGAPAAAALVLNKRCRGLLKKWGAEEVASQRCIASGIVKVRGSAAR